MPRAGLSSQDVVAAAAQLADEVGFKDLTMGLLAQRLGIRTPSLYKHVTDLADLRYRIAVLAMGEVGEALRDGLQGKSGRDALAVLFSTIRDYAIAHPGRYAATSGVRITGPDDPLRVAGGRVVDSVAAALHGYGIAETEMVHAIRTLRSVLHGFVLLEQDEGFQYSEDPGVTLDWMIQFFDRGLRATRALPGGQDRVLAEVDRRAHARCGRFVEHFEVEVVPQGGNHRSQG